MPWPRPLVMLPRFCRAFVAFLPRLCKGLSLCVVLHEFYALALCSRSHTLTHWGFTAHTYDNFTSNILSLPLTHWDFGICTLGLHCSHIGTSLLAHWDFGFYTYELWLLTH